MNATEAANVGVTMSRAHCWRTTQSALGDIAIAQIEWEGGREERMKVLDFLTVFKDDFYVDNCTN